MKISKTLKTSEDEEIQKIIAVLPGKIIYASGKIQKICLRTYTKENRGFYKIGKTVEVYKKPKKNNKGSPKSLLRALIFRRAQLLYTAQTEEIKNYYRKKIKQRRILGNNAFIKENKNNIILFYPLNFFGKSGFGKYAIFEKRIISQYAIAPMGICWYGSSYKRQILFGDFFGDKICF